MSDKPRAIIVDIDGTIALHGPGHNDRGHYEYDKVDQDAPDLFNIKSIAALSLIHDAEIILVTGRNENCAFETVLWLASFRRQQQYTRLFMRPDSDQWRKRPDDELKKWIYETQIKDHWDVILVVDDRNRVVKMWRSLGLRVYQVADGDF